MLTLTDKKPMTTAQINVPQQATTTAQDKQLRALERLAAAMNLDDLVGLSEIIEKNPKIVSTFKNNPFVRTLGGF